MTDQTDAAAAPPRDILGAELPQTREILHDWFRRRLAPAEVRLTRMDKMAGGSHELLDLDIEWTKEGVTERAGVMVRFDPVSFRKRRTSNLAREFTIQSILGKLGSPPVPQVLWYEADAGLLGAPFYAMRRVGGLVPRDRPAYQLEGWVVELSPADRRKLWTSAVKTLAAVHRTPVEAIAELRTAPAGVDDFTHHLNSQYDNFLWACGGQAPPAVEAGWRWLFDNLPANRPAGIAWGDARYGNMIFENAEVSAVLDWEDVSLAGPMFDMGRWSLSEELHEIWNLPRLEGFGSREEMVKLWEAESGLSAADLRWYEVFNACFAAGLTARIAQAQTTRKDAPAAPAGFTGSTLEDLITRWIATA